MLFVTRNLFKTKLRLLGCDLAVARWDQEVASCDQVVAMYDFMLADVTKPVGIVTRCCQV